MVRPRILDLFSELSLGPGSIYSEIVDRAPDPRIYPEVEWDAEVRLGEELCMAERAFLGERKRMMRPAFAKLIGVEESEVDERDIPVVAIAGSGGGARHIAIAPASLADLPQVIARCSTP